MAFSDVERRSLYLQFLTLHRVDPGQSWDQYAEIIHEGYEAYYPRIEQLLSEPLSSDDCRYVEDIFSVYDALQWPIKAKGGTVPRELKFPGFDGNNEGKRMGYARFLRNDGRWASVETWSSDLNSHATLESEYRRKIAEWKKLGRPHELTGANAAAVSGK